MAHPQRTGAQRSVEGTRIDDPLHTSAGQGPPQVAQTPIAWSTARFEPTWPDQAEERELIFYCARPSAADTTLSNHESEQQVVEMGSRNSHAFRGLFEVFRRIGFPLNTA